MNTCLQNLREQSTHKQYVSTLKTLVGDEIQCHRIIMWKNGYWNNYPENLLNETVWCKSLHLCHLEVKSTLQEVQVILADICSRYSGTFPPLSPWEKSWILWSLRLPTGKNVPREQSMIQYTCKGRVSRSIPLKSPWYGKSKVFQQVTPSSSTIVNPRFTIFNMCTLDIFPNEIGTITSLVLTWSHAWLF